MIAFLMKSVAFSWPMDRRLFAMSSIDFTFPSRYPAQSTYIYALLRVLGMPQNKNLANKKTKPGNRCHYRESGEDMQYNLAVKPVQQNPIYVN